MRNIVKNFEAPAIEPSQKTEDGLKQMSGFNLPVSTGFGAGTGLHRPYRCRAGISLIAQPTKIAHPISMSGMPLEKPQRATYADLMAVPDHLVAEIIDGELIVSPRPAVLHARASSRLTAVLGGPFDWGRDGPGGWVILIEPELHLGPEPDVLVPDLAGWRRERMPELPDTASVSLAPDWVCEVLSPSSEKVDRARKMRIYAREKVAHLWLINPTPQTLEVFRLESPGWFLAAVHQGNEKVRAEPFDAIELDLAALWER